MLKHKAINGWRLFWLGTGPISVAMIIAMARTDLSNGPAVSSMVQFSVRCAVPLLFVAFAASSIQKLFPGQLGIWMLRNRKYAGLCFAAAMAWQGFFILWLTIIHSDYYVNEVYVLRDAIEGVLGYLVLTAMVATSFKPGRKLLKPGNWRLLHLSGIYFLWAYAFSVYWWNLSYYDNPQPIDYVFYWMGFFAFALRIAAWGKKRLQAAEKNAPGSSTRFEFKLLGGAIIAFGLFASAASLYFQEPITAFLTTPEWSADLVLWLPYWPFEPYLSIFIIGLGTLLATKSRA